MIRCPSSFAVQALIPNDEMPSCERIVCHCACPGIGAVFEVVERAHRVPRAHVASRSRSSTTGSISSSPSTRSSRFSTPAHEASDSCPARPSRSFELGAERVVDGEPPVARRAAEERVVQAVEATELGERIGVVVDAQIDERVRQARVAAVALDDEQGRGLPPATVATGRLGRVEAVEQPLGERRARRRLERLRERVDGRARDEDVPLGGVALSRAAAGPGVALVTRERGRPALAVDDPELTDARSRRRPRSAGRRPPRP